MVSSSEAYVFYAGGRDGWVVDPAESYNHWAERNRFQVNDTIGTYVHHLTSVLIDVVTSPFYRITHGYQESIEAYVRFLARSVHVRRGRGLGAAGDRDGLRRVQHAQPGPAARQRRRRTLGVPVRPFRPLLLRQRRRGPVPEGTEAVHHRDGGSADEAALGAGARLFTDHAGVPAGQCHRAAAAAVGLGAGIRAGAGRERVGPFW